jgi:hypothetical protein
MRKYSAAVLVVFAGALCFAGSAEAARGSARRIIAGSAANGDSGPGVWKTVCVDTEISSLTLASGG